MVNQTLVLRIHPDSYRDGKNRHLLRPNISQPPKNPSQQPSRFAVVALMKRTIATNNFVDELQPRLVFSPAVFFSGL